MKGLFLLLLLFSLLSALAVAASTPRNKTPKLFVHFSPSKRRNLSPPSRSETQYYRQNLDHFSFAPLPDFDQRYLIGSFKGWSRNGPIFFYCGNEGDIEWFAANTGLVWEMAPQFSALVVFAEHRYYGESMPYGSKERAYKDAKSMSYLTTEQALADFSTLLIDLKRNLSSEDSPVLLFGGSYGGRKLEGLTIPSRINKFVPRLYVLAAWMRLKYPHVVIGALASSAPILQFEDIVPSETFYDIVSSDFRRESLNCFEAIKKSWDELDDQGEQCDGLTSLSRKFRLCRELNNTQQLSDWLSSAYSNLAMVNYPYPSEFLTPLPAYPVKVVCRNIDNHPNGTALLDHIFAGVSMYYNYTGNIGCFDLEDDPHGMSGWNWQACTEMVMPMSSSRENSMFPPYDFDYAAYEDECAQSYNVKPRPRWVTTEFGGHDIRRALKEFGSNIIFSNGLLDPWSGGGVLQNISESITALVTELGAHHLDLRAFTAEDPQWLKEQRNLEIKMIEGWISDYYKQKVASFSM